MLGEEQHPDDVTIDIVTQTPEKTPTNLNEVMSSSSQNLNDSYNVLMREIGVGDDEGLS